MADDVYERLLSKLPEIAEAVKAFDNPAVQEKAFEALARSLGVPSPGTSSGERDSTQPPPPSPRKTGARKRARAERRAGGGGNTPRPKGRRAGVTAVRHLDFRPQGVLPFKEFAAAKAPGTLQEQNAVAVFYLVEHMDVDKVGIGHVLAAFREAGWKPAADPANALQLTANRKGWFDTSDSEDIKMTPSGMHLVEHDLPRAKPKK